MVENGSKVSIIVSEPWDANLVLKGMIIRSINSGKYFVIRDDKSNELYLVVSRYKGVMLSDLAKGSTVTVGHK